MFYTLLFATFFLAAVVTYGVVKLFSKPVSRILTRVIRDEISTSWEKYITFAAYVVGISGGVRIYQIEQYISPSDPESEILVLNAERWTLEVFRTIIATLQSIAWMYLVVFVFALIAYVIVRGQEMKRAAVLENES